VITDLRHTHSDHRLKTHSQRVPTKDILTVITE